MGFVVDKEMIICNDKPFYSCT